MNAVQQRLWNDVHEGRVDEVSQFILEYILYHGCDEDCELIDELVAVYFYRLENEE